MTKQWLRKASLVVGGGSGSGVDLSELRFKFNIKKGDLQTPNTCDIRVYNVSDATASRVQREYSRVVLQAGYEGNFGLIFDGNVKQVRRGRESATDTYIDILAADGDLAYIHAVVSTTLAAGASQADQVKAASGAMAEHGVTTGHVPDLGSQQLPRGKVMHGMARDTMRDVADSTDTTWSIQDGKMQMVPMRGVLPGAAAVLTAKTGLIGMPEQTNEGIKAKCLLNRSRAMPDKLLPQFGETALAAVWAVFWAFLGRLMYVLNLVRLGKRKRFFSLQTVWELGVAIGMGVVAGGLSEYVGLQGLPAAGFIAAASYLGPHVIELGLAWMAQKAGVDHPPPAPASSTASATAPSQTVSCGEDCHDCPLGPECLDYRGKTS